MTANANFKMTDLQLMRRVQDNDTEAFGALYDRLAPRALRVASAVLGGDVNRAEDAVQEGFLSIWRGRGHYEPGRGQVHAWAFGIVRNRAIDNLRRAYTHDSRRANLDDHEEQLPADADLEAGAVADASARDLRALLARLPEAQREVIALAFFGQLSHSEIAQQLTVPIGTVKGRMRLGLAKLRDQLEIIGSI